MNFIPLHVNGPFSYLRSGLKIDKYLKTASKYGYKSVGLTDFESLTGAPSFAKDCFKAGLKPLIGEDIEINGLVVTFFAINEIGYRTLVKLHNKKVESEISLDDVRNNNDGLVVIIDISQDLIEQAFNNENDFARYFYNLTKGIVHFYCGINDDGRKRPYIEKFREFAQGHSYNSVAFPFIKYLNRDDELILKMVEAIKDDKELELNDYVGPNYLLNPTEVEHLYLDSEINTTKEISDLINFEIEAKRGKMVTFKNDLGISSEEYLKRMAYDNLVKLNIADDKHQKRLKEELDVIISMGFADYFLIVQDYVNWARNNNIPVGPGRGSAAGSLVSYVLNITAVDPLEYDLIFERFLNKARQTMPDIDVDFSDIKREYVVKYIRQKYGNDHVSNILTAQTIGARQALRDVGRIFKYPARDIELLTKLIPTHHSANITLRETYKTVKAFRELLDNDSYYLKIVSLASKIEGFPRQKGMHAAGIVINADPLNEVIPIAKDEEGNLIEEYEMTYLEEQGFLKMDILAIRNLTIVEECLEKLKKKGINLKMDEIPYKDEDAIRIIREGNTTGIFQLESSGMRNAIRLIEPETFDDIVAVLALFRPGPMQEIKSYALRKAGKEKVEYIDKSLEPILSSTYGIIIYQEQIMQIASIYAGLSLSESDLFRRAISKKDTSKLSSLRETFINGAIKKGHTRRVATDVYELILKFANYGFNKSHSLSYAIFSARMAYLKAHYKEEFFSAILDNTGGESDSFTLAISEIRNSNIELLNPDVNASTDRFEIKDNKLLFPLNRIKGLFNEVANNIIKDREIYGPFTDYYDFILRIKRYKVNPVMIMKLINAGALDSLDASRASLRINMPNALQYSELLSDQNGVAIIDMADFSKPIYNHIQDDYVENLNLEYEALGLMISGSPLDIVKDQIKDLDVTKISLAKKDNATKSLVGIVKTIKTIKTKKGQPMAFISIYDESGEIEVTVFSDTYEVSSTYLKRNKVILIKGYYQQSRDSFIANEISEINEGK